MISNGLVVSLVSEEGVVSVAVVLCDEVVSWLRADTVTDVVKGVGECPQAAANAPSRLMIQRQNASTNESTLVDFCVVLVQIIKDMLLGLGYVGGTVVSIISFVLVIVSEMVDVPELLVLPSVDWIITRSSTGDDVKSMIIVSSVEGGSSFVRGKDAFCMAALWVLL